jgi:hypothetical protein
MMASRATSREWESASLQLAIWVGSVPLTFPILVYGRDKVLDSCMLA